MALKTGSATPSAVTDRLALVVPSSDVAVEAAPCATLSATGWKLLVSDSGAVRSASACTRRSRAALLLVASRLSSCSQLRRGAAGVPCTSSV